MTNQAAVSSAKRRFNVDEYRLMAESGILPDRVELVDGRIMWGDKERRFSVAEYRLMVDAGILSSDGRHELMDGEIIRVPVDADYRARCFEILQVDVLLSDFRNALATVVIRSNEPIRLSDYSELKPDVALLRPYANLYKEGHSHPDDVMLIVEVSRLGGEYDGNMKVPLYAEAGVPELWLLNLEEDCIEGLSDPTGSDYRVKRRYERGDLIAPALLPRALFEVEGLLIPKRRYFGEG